MIEKENHHGIQAHTKDGKHIFLPQTSQYVDPMTYCLLRFWMESYHEKEKKSNYKRVMQSNSLRLLCIFIK